MMRARLTFKAKILMLGIAAMFLLNTRTFAFLFSLLPQRLRELISSNFAIFKENFRITMSHFWHNMDVFLRKYFGEDPMSGIADLVIFLLMCYAQGYLLYYIYQKWHSKRSGYYAGNTKYKTTLKQGTMLVLEPIKDIYISSQKEAIRVLKTLRDYNRKTRMIGLRREYSMILLLDENKKLLLAVIDNIGSYAEVKPMGHEIVYSYNTSFNGACKKVIFAHTHAALTNIDGVYCTSIPMATVQDKNIHEQLKRLIYPIEIIDHLVLPAIDRLPPYSVASDAYLKDEAKKIRAYPRWYFRTMYNGFGNNEPMMPTAVGVKLKYAKKSRQKGREKEIESETYQYKA